MGNLNIEAIMKEIRGDIAARSSQDDTPAGPGVMSSYHRNMLERLSKAEEIILFGVGRYGRMIINEFRRGGIHTIKGFCDNNKNVLGMDIEGVTVMSPEEAFRKYPSAIFVITALNYPVEITAQLLKIGLSADRIIFYNFARSGL